MARIDHIPPQPQLTNLLTGSTIVTLYNGANVTVKIDLTDKDNQTLKFYHRGQERLEIDLARIANDSDRKR